MYIHDLISSLYEFVKYDCAFAKTWLTMDVLLSFNAFSHLKFRLSINIDVIVPCTKGAHR